MSLPIFKTDDKDLMLLQTRWSSQLNPVLRAEITNGQILKSVSLVTGANIINHLLGRKLLGWFLVRLRAPGANVYDTQDTNPNPQQTLLLTSSADVVADIYVF